MIYIVDIDGTICKTTNGKYRESKPIKTRIKKLNELHQKGHKIIYFTSRGTITGKDWKEITKKQFENWGVEYDSLIFGKPFGDFYIDNHAVKDTDFFK